MKKSDIKKFGKWLTTFTKAIVTVVTILWGLSVIYSAITIFYAIYTNGDFSYLDAFITDMGETFRTIVGANIISKTIENVFKYNDSPFFGVSKQKEVEEVTENEAVG